MCILNIFLNLLVVLVGNRTNRFNCSVFFLPWFILASAVMLTLSSPSLLEHIYSEATAPIPIASDLDSSASPEDCLLHQLLRAVEAEARRLASRREPGCHYEADQYMVNMKNRVWNSMSLVQARLNEALNRRVPIARLPNEILGKIFEFYMVEWFKEYRSSTPRIVV